MATLKLIFAAKEPRLADAWRREFDGISNVEIYRGSIFEVAADALVSPANSLGFMDGGIDALYSQRFGWDMQLCLRRLIRDHHCGELLVGSAEILETHEAGFKRRSCAVLVQCQSALHPTMLLLFGIATDAIRVHP